MAHGARRRLRDAVAPLERRLPKIAALLEEAETDVLAFYPSPAEHWPKIRSTNPLERFNREIGVGADLVPANAASRPSEQSVRARSDGAGALG
jgi:transposase-like protein